MSTPLAGQALIISICPVRLFFIAIVLIVTLPGSFLLRVHWYDSHLSGHICESAIARRKSQSPVSCDKIWKILVSKR